MNDERFDVYLDQTKEFADNCLVESFAGITNYDDLLRLFVEGEVAVAWLGVWSSTVLAEDLNFDSTVTYLPPITSADQPFSIFEDTSFRVSGPSSLGQLGITQQTVDAGLFEEALDFLMWWTSPQVYQRVYDSHPVFVPMVAGTVGSEIANSFQFIAAKPERLFTDSQGRLTPEFGTEHNRLFQQFMLGEIDADTLKSRIQEIMDQAVDDLCLEQDWEFCQQ